ncbi:hypothetical protein DPMN_141065 [Dreissena polymorpha]|uniref:Uncharacterized protein n=1 Tax=Dreissena polymorpha TaxID=45954 RepID=A0A9D4JJJ8_DREPO|nr:hypothetical protein DPMN_141065 [Dreissena polymorpha]
MTLHPGDSCVNNWMLKAMAKDSGFLKHKRITNHSVRKFLAGLMYTSLDWWWWMNLADNSSFFKQFIQTTPAEPRCVIRHLPGLTGAPTGNLREGPETTGNDRRGTGNNRDGIVAPPKPMQIPA